MIIIFLFSLAKRSQARSFRLRLAIETFLMNKVIKKWAQWIFRSKLANLVALPWVISIIKNCDRDNGSVFSTMQCGWLSIREFIRTFKRCCGCRCVNGLLFLVTFFSWYILKFYNWNSFRKCKQLMRNDTFFWIAIKSKKILYTFLTGFLKIHRFSYRLLVNDGHLFAFSRSN